MSSAPFLSVSIATNHFTKSTSLQVVPGPSSIGVTADIAFLVDSSAKTGRSNFHLEKMFIKSITRRFTINRHHSHVGVVSYTSRPSLQMRFNQYNSVTEVNRAVDRMRFSGGRGRRVDLAVRSSYNWFFNRGPSFPFVRKILVVVVNGRQTGRSVFMFNRMRSLFARKNVKVFVVGVGGVDQRYLRPLTYRNRHVYVVRNFRSLVAKAGTIAKAIHSEMNIANELYQRMRLPKPEATQQQVTYFDKPLPNATVISTPVNGTHMA
ncbi:predicted protein [Nematostella vectensis]|uniref:VWFA domain-containing protein n=1 Tax=Nematostella vectensis TaxID=45351 RepID=A7RT06_NEMVE|nr:predicted protein [Nematostella vectensis]|eukprot:XP_001637429.1 predicted protein [Nematostella vectensis]